jgi:hypothetical protein
MMLRMSFRIGERGGERSESRRASEQCRPHICKSSGIGSIFTWIFTIKYSSQRLLFPFLETMNLDMKLPK